MDRLATPFLQQNLGPRLMALCFSCNIGCVNSGEWQRRGDRFSSAEADLSIVLLKLKSATDTQTNAQICLPLAEPIAACLAVRTVLDDLATLRIRLQAESGPVHLEMPTS